jgi:putative NIF3 family GTP cyclohydrolase 1 type 2
MPACTIADAIARIETGLPMAAREQTVDTVKLGDPTQALTGIVVTFMATTQVLARCVELGANLVVTHEPTWYNHLDESEWLAKDVVAQEKRTFLEQHQLVVWRLHDRLHRSWPDDIAVGMLDALGWRAHVVAERAPLLQLPEQSLQAVVSHCKAKLGIKTLKVVGNLEQRVRSIAFMPGASGGRRQMINLGQPGVDVVICGESPEWETCEYVRDAVANGHRKALVVLGHANSEEIGMRALATRVGEWLPGTPVHHLPAGDPFQFC